jgi:hypothetical protein
MKVVLVKERQNEQNKNGKGVEIKEINAWKRWS